MYELYYQPFACSFAVHTALEKIGQPFQLHKIELAKGDQRSAEFLALNPQGQVPVLKQGEMTMTQAAAILMYLSEQHETAELMPSVTSPERRAALQQLFFISNTLHPTLSRLFHPKRFSESAPDEVKTLAIEKVHNLLANVNDTLETQAFIVGDIPYAVDYYLFAVLNWLRMFGIRLDACPNIKRFIKTMKTVPEVQRAMLTESQNMAA